MQPKPNCFPSPLPVTMNDLLPWSIYDYFRGTYLRIPVLFFNPWSRTARCAWHTSPESVYPHTRRYRLLRALTSNDLPSIKQLLDEGYDVNSVIDFKYGFTPLTLAAHLNQPQLLEYLLLRGALLNKKDGREKTALERAVGNYNLESLKLLMDSGAEKGKAELIARFKGFKSGESILMKGGKEKSFPKFKIKFDFIEDELDDKVLDSMLWGKKFFESKILLYPFNDLKGNYYLSLFNFKTYNDLVEERQRNEKKL